MAAQPIRAANEQNEAVKLWITGALLNKTFGFNKSSPKNSNKKKKSTYNSHLGLTYHGVK